MNDPLKDAKFEAKVLGEEILHRAYLAFEDHPLVAKLELRDADTMILVCSSHQRTFEIKVEVKVL